jgi:predicted MFS family arabinose efflux permease
VSQGGLQRERALPAVLVLTTLVASIVSSLGAPLIPTVAHDFHDSLSSAQWSLTAALLAGAVSAPVMGRLGDGAHRRATMIGGLVAVTAGGIVAAFAGGLDVLVIGRALQGVALGLVPLSMATARDELPPDEVASMIGLLSVSAAAGVGAGYPISGLIAEHAGLSGAFWFGAGVSALTLLMVVAVVPAPTGHDRRARLDWIGATLLTTALVGILLAVAQGTAWGWASPRILVLLVAGLMLLAGWTLQQLHATTPLVELRLVRHPAVLAADGCAFVLGVAMYMDLSSVTEFVQLPRSQGFGFSASVVLAGLTLVPLSAFMLVGSRTLPFLLRYLGARPVLTIGCLVVGASGGFFALFHNGIWAAFVMMGILGAGLGTTYAAIPGLIVAAVPQDETGSAMGFYQVVRYVGFALGSAVTAAILAGRASSLGQPTLAGFTTVLWVAGAISVIAAVTAWVLPGRDREVPPEQRLPADEVRLAEQTEGEDLIVGRVGRR